MVIIKSDNKNNNNYNKIKLIVRHSAGLYKNIMITMIYCNT